MLQTLLPLDTERGIKLLWLVWTKHTSKHTHKHTHKQARTPPVHRH